MVLSEFNQNYTSTKYDVNKYIMSLLSQMSNSKEADNKKEDDNKTAIDNLDLIYAEDGEGNYNESMDYDKNDKISYIEYLRYCEQNAKETPKYSDTVVSRNDKLRFMTTSFGKASNAYLNNSTAPASGKVESKA